MAVNRLKSAQAAFENFSERIKLSRLVINYRLNSGNFHLHQLHHQLHIVLISKLLVIPSFLQSRKTFVSLVSLLL